MRAVLTTLRAFVAAGLRPKTPLARGIVLALCVKVCVVVAMRLFLFGSDTRVAVDHSVMDDRLTPVSAQDQGN